MKKKTTKQILPLPVSMPQNNTTIITYFIFHAIITRLPLVGHTNTNKLINPAQKDSNCIIKIHSQLSNKCKIYMYGVLLIWKVIFNVGNFVDL